MIGVFVGDIIGSVYEFKKRVNYDFSPLFHHQARFTDDTICSLAVMDGLLNELDPTTALHQWGRKYWSVGGWGKRYAMWLATSTPTPYGSFGNGGAMRIASAGWVAKSEAEVIDLSDRFTAVTHNHPDGLAAARATSLAVYLARQNNSQQNIRQRLSEYYDLNFTVASLIPGYQRTEIAKDSVPQAIACALEATCFEDAIRKAISLSGDTDTQAAIAGGIAEALYGVPETIATKALHYLDQDMQQLTANFYARFVS